MADLAPITDYPSLLAALEAYLARDDLQAFAPLFVQQAEGRFNTDLKVVDMHASVGPTVLDASGGVALPADFIDWISVRWYPVAPSTQRPLFLNYREPDSPEFRHRHRPNGVPSFYTLLGGKVRIAAAVPGSLEVFYYERIPPLTVASPVNWLITKAPEVYLYAALWEAMLFQKDEVRSAQWSVLLNSRLAAIFGQTDSQKVGTRQARAANDAADMAAAKNMT
ncbi:hypothetical protein ASG40_12985 [Methylobacterium sp. Leaf399]|uniref:phage adaptor protein n=1 Tax=unclassified Methylobacterium TaxID=2615210 RepID=UPI0006F56EFF|nr:MULTISPECIES: hypothetical protein [unclassified Methylobacterium]KQP50835.1 hypothetical protein ASF39_11365 [Methylobacterium sp. Leaf108]KQT07816.1 hypothetical protein ASG40_12985 [Methylobacterium sp. Leaf399]KQT88931.1 hypothetical protein ASG59_13755 [Methylobacterium sp. Leaf466]